GSASAAAAPSCVQGGAAAVAAGDVERLCTGDFDGDGHADVAAAVPGRIVLAHGDGTGRLGTPAILLDTLDTGPGANGTASCAAGDLDGDGTADLAVGDSAAATLTLVMDGRATTIDMPGPVMDVKLGHRDGKPELF